MKNEISTFILSAAFMVPMSKENWTELKFGKIKANTVTYSENKITVDVQKSASPLIYKLEKSMLLNEFDFEIQIKGKIISDETSFSEDSYFRLGLVAEGEKKLSGMKKMFAPDWVKKLFSLAPEGVGLDKIYFFNVMSGNQKLKAHRIHPKSELMEESIVALNTAEDGKIKVNHKLTQPLKISALWISIDGDDTKSDFKAEIQKINLNSVGESSNTSRF
jgi:hypothetical protein